MADPADHGQPGTSQTQMKVAESIRVNQTAGMLSEKPNLNVLITQNQDSSINDPAACQDQGVINDDYEQISSSVHKLDKSKRPLKKPRKLQDDPNEMLLQQSTRKRQKIDGDTPISQSPMGVDDTEQDGEEGDVGADNSMAQEDINQLGKAKQKYGHKKQNFTAVQTQILKRWFIQNADNPYLKEENRKELSEQTGLDQRQVSNWFTNVRKRVWQPLKKKNKNKNVNDIMLKVKLKLEADPLPPSHSACSSSDDFSINELMKDPNKLNRRAIKKRQQHQLQQMGGMIEEMTQSQHRHQQQMSQIGQHSTAGQHAFNILRNPGQQTTLPPLQQPLSLNQFQAKFPQNTINQVSHLQTQQQQTAQPQMLQSEKQSQILKIIDQFRRQEEQKRLNEQMIQNMNNFPKTLQSILKDPSTTHKPPTLMQPVQQDNQQLRQMGQKVPSKILLDKNQNLPSMTPQPVPQVSQHQSQNNAQITSFLGLQRRPSVQQQQPPYQQTNNLVDHFQQIEMLKKKINEIQQQELSQKQSTAKSPVPAQTQFVQVNQPPPTTLQQIQTEPIASTHHHHQNNNLMLNNLTSNDIDPKTQTFENNNIYEQTKRPQDNIINTQMTQKESLQGEDLRSLASKFHMNKNLIEIDFKKIDKDNSAGHTHSVVDKDKGAINFGVMSDTSMHHNAGHRIAMKKFLKESKNLRYREKMKNVMQWRSNQLEYALRNKDLLEDPAKDEQNKNLHEVLDPEKIEMIEKEFLEHQNLVDQLAKQKALEKESDHKNLSSNKLKQKERNSSRRRQDGSKNDDEQSNDGVEVVSLHRSKSLSNNRSLSQFEDQVTENQVNTINAPFQFIPIVLVSCPNVVKGGECKCGFDGFYPANDFYKNQLQQFITNQGQLLNVFNKGQHSSQNNSGGSGAGGSGGSGCADSGAGRGRNGSSSNHQSNGNSWQTTANYTHPFLTLLNQFNHQANCGITGQKNKGSTDADQNFQNSLSGVRNMAELIQKISHTCSQVKDKLKEKHQESVPNTGGTQATLNQNGGGNAPAQSNQQEDTTGKHLMEHGPEEKPYDVDRRAVAKQNNQHIIPPSVNFISHLEQASLLKNQLEVLNEITNQFHELMRLDKIKQKIVQIQKDQGKDAVKKIDADGPDQEQAQMETEQAREEPIKQATESPATAAQQQQLNKVQYHTSDTEQVGPMQGQTLKQRIQRNSRTMSEHKSSQNQNSQANMHPPPMTAGQAAAPTPLNNQSNVLFNQLQSVLNLLYNQQKNNSNKQLDEQNKQQQNLQIVQLLKKQSMVNKATQRAGSDCGQNLVATSNKSTRHTEPSQLLSNNWLSNKNIANNKNCDNDQMGQDNKQINSNIQTLHLPVQSNVEAQIDSYSVRQNTQTAGANMNLPHQKVPQDETCLGNLVIPNQQFNTAQALQDRAAQERNQDPSMDQLLPCQQQQVYQLMANAGATCPQSQSQMLIRPRLAPNNRPNCSSCRHCNNLNP